MRPIGRSPRPLDGVSSDEGESHRMPPTPTLPADAGLYFEHSQTMSLSFGARLGFYEVTGPRSRRELRLTRRPQCR